MQFWAALWMRRLKQGLEVSSGCVVQIWKWNKLAPYGLFPFGEQGVLQEWFLDCGARAENGVIPWKSLQLALPCKLRGSGGWHY